MGGAPAESIEIVDHDPDYWQKLLFAMREVLGDYPRERFPIPQGVVFARIDRTTGLRARGHENVVVQPFREGTEPTEFAPSANGPRGPRQPRLD